MVKTMKTPEQTVRLSDVRGIARIIAAAMLREHGEYYCMMDGKRTQIVEG